MVDASNSDLSILIVDDEEGVRSILSDYFSDLGYQVSVAENAAETLALFERSKFDFVILDVHLPDSNGLDLAGKLKTRQSMVDIIVITGNMTQYDYVNSFEAGASDFISKPFDLQEIQIKLGRLRFERERRIELLNNNRELEKTRLEMERIVSNLKSEIRGKKGFVLPEAPQGREDFPEIIGQSKEIEKVLDLVRLVAKTDSSVLITGESGTGKELIARAVHKEGPRGNRPFIPVNCGALPETLIESELFGHEKGAFTGAVSSKRGLIEEADGGTLFLDEIGETSPAFQMKLLRVLQEGEIKRVGATRGMTVDIRVISATNASLEAMMSNGSFREDLYYRIKEFSVAIPALRDRIDDLALLSQFLLEKSCAKCQRPLVGFASEAMRKMFRYSWPGNIRELENMITQAVILAVPPLIELEDMPILIEQVSKHPRKTRVTDRTFAQAKEDFECEYFKAVLQRNQGNISASARMCQLERKHFREKVRKLGLLDDPDAYLRNPENDPPAAGAEAGPEEEPVADVGSSREPELSPA
ncbi:MAG: sigma-54 dependent transcriptional regulator [Nitrospinota bacterium]|nr:sigma-54 dependent transcriptional regulator [Nitrospinota bacterium]